MAFEQTTFRRYGRFYRNVGKYASRQEVLISVYLILSLFTISFFAAVFIRPTAITIARIWREIQDKKTIHAQLDKKITDLEEAQSLYASLDNDLPAVARALPENEDYLSLAQKLEYLAFVNEVKFVSSNFGAVEIYASEEPQTPPSSLGIHALNLSFQGSNQSILSFIEDIERLDRLVTIHSLTLIPAQDVSSAGGFNLSLAINSNVYSFPEGLDLGD